MFGLEYAVPREVHHAVGEAGAEEYAYGCDYEDCFVGACFGSHGGVEEVHGVVADAYGEVEDGEGEEEDYDAEVESFHVEVCGGRCFRVFEVVRPRALAGEGCGVLAWFAGGVWRYGLVAIDVSGWLQR